MQRAEFFILSCDLPSFLIVERHLNAVLSISPVVDWVINHHSVFYFALYPHLEKVGSTKVVHVFWTSLDML